MKKAIKTDKAPAVASPFSQAVRVGDLIFVSGMFGIDPATKKMKGEAIEDQTRQAIRNTEAILEEAGSSLDRVVKVTVILTDWSRFGRLKAVCMKYFVSRRPAFSAHVGGLLKADALVQIDVVAEA